MFQLIQIIEKERSMRKQLQDKVTSLTEEKEILIKENKMLKSEIQTHSERHEIQAVNENRTIFSAQTSKYLALEEHNKRETLFTNVITFYAYSFS